MHDATLPGATLSAPTILEAISPARGAKYSPNLYKWIVKTTSARPQIAQLPSVYRDGSGALWIGEVDNQYQDGLWFTGALLMAVLCHGIRQRSCAFPVGPDDYLPVADFWDCYARDGRCAVDVAHAITFIGSETRWKSIGAIRSCTWCAKVKHASQDPTGNGRPIWVNLPDLVQPAPSPTTPSA